jgi:hypothetical protein
VKGDDYRAEEDKWVSGVNWAVVIHDEFHTEKNKGTQAVTLLKALNQGHDEPVPPPLFVIMSGTPIEKSPEDIKYYIEALHYYAGTGVVDNNEVLNRWAFNDKLCHCEPSVIDGLTAKWNTLAKQVELIEKNADELERLAVSLGNVWSALMIRRLKDTIWYGKPIIRLPPNFHEDRTCRLTEQQLAQIKSLSKADAKKKAFQQRIKAWEEGGKEGPAPSAKQAVTSYLFNATEERIAASFPYLVQMREKEVIANFTWEEVKKWLKDVGNSPYLKHIGDLIRNNAKIEELGKIVDIILGGADKDGLPEKGVIVSVSPQCAFIIVVVRMSRPVPFNSAQFILYSRHYIACE